MKNKAVGTVDISTSSMVFLHNCIKNYIRMWFGVSYENCEIKENTGNECKKWLFSVELSTQLIKLRVQLKLHKLWGGGKS